MTSTTPPAPRIGWIGAGRMGAVMAERLLKAGFDLAVHNRTPEKAAGLARHGASIAPDVAALAECDVVFTIVSTSEAAEEVILGERGLLSSARAPKIVVECSTIGMETSAALRKALADRGAAYLCAPISGNPHVVEAGNSTFVASGSQEAFRAVELQLRAIARNVVYVGEGDAARIAKICHNVWLGVLTQSLAEITVLAQKAGMTRQAFLDFINASALGSVYTKVKTPTWVALEFTPPTFTPPLMRKDMELGLALGRQLEAPLALASVTRDLIQTQINHGYQDLDFSSLLLMQARAAGLEMVPEPPASSGSR
jgi:3-hydroxyisobutyrate dehydrogenase-like beta-hydroxyacid dehydrogenase